MTSRCTARPSRADGGSARPARRRPRSGRTERAGSLELVGDTGLDLEVALTRRPLPQGILERPRSVGAERRETSDSAGRQREPQFDEVVVDIDTQPADRCARRARAALGDALKRPARTTAPRTARSRGRQARLGLQTGRSTFVVSAATPSLVTTSQSGLAGLPGSMRLVTPPVSQATGPAPFSTTARPRRSSRPRTRQASPRPRPAGRGWCDGSVVRPYRTSFRNRKLSCEPALSIAGQWICSRRSVRHSKPLFVTTEQ